MTARRLGLGTVQFGLDYGISNPRGQVPPAEIGRILTHAAAAGITLLDTASSYGSSEQRLGQQLPTINPPFRIVTKSPPTPLNPGPSLLSALTTSLQRLRQKRLYGLLIHHANDLFKPSGKQLLAALWQCQKQGLVQKIGVSVYSSVEIDRLLTLFTPDIVQLPINVADQRLIQSGHLQKLKKRGIEIHARSLFLQGVLLMPPAPRPPFFFPMRHHFETLHHTFNEQGCSPLEGCLRFGLAQTELDTLLVGVTTVTELEEILAAVQRAETDKNQLPFPQLAINETRFLNPAQWVLQPTG